MEHPLIVSGIVLLPVRRILSAGSLWDFSQNHQYSTSFYSIHKEYHNKTVASDLGLRRNYPITSSYALTCMCKDLGGFF